MAFANVAAAAVSVVGGSLLADDNGAEAANGAAADSTRLQAEIARDQWNRYKEIYQPLEKQMVSDAQNYDSPANYAKAAGEASATVSQQFGKARDRLARTPGLDPSSAGYAANLAGLEMSQAASDATAQNAARQGVRDTAYSRKQAALGLGKGLDSTASSGLATSASNSLSLAKYAQGQSDQNAQMIGGAIQQAVGSPTTQNWLRNTFSPTSGGSGAVGQTVDLNSGAGLNLSNGLSLNF